jgi:hypothetical protein
MNTPGDRYPLTSAGSAAEVRWIEIDLSDLALPASMARLDQLALAMAHVYERFVPYADQGWEWVTFPGSREFDGWIYSDRAVGRIITGVKLLSRRAAADERMTAARPVHGVSAYRTWQLTSRPWTAEPGSKRWKALS